MNQRLGFIEQISLVEQVHQVEAAVGGFGIVAQQLGDVDISSHIFLCRVILEL